MRLERKTVGGIGLSSVVILITSILIFGFLNSDFSLTQDFISKLGARGEPNSQLFNIVGFGIVGILLFLFGFAYGSLLNDKLLAYLIGMFGLGFALTSIPIDIEHSRAVISKVHILSICLGSACWLLGLSRLSYNLNFDKKIRCRANIAAVLLVASMIGFVLGLWSMPITHRLVFGIVFGWTAITSVELYFTEPNVQELLE